MDGNEIVQGVVENVIANFITSSLLLIVGVIGLKFAERNLSFAKRYKAILALVRNGIYLGLVIALYKATTIIYPDKGEISLAMLIATLSAMYLARVLKIARAKAVGIMDFEPEIVKGTNYDKALKKCKFSLEFLGVGASKLTDEPEFEKALARCSENSGVIKFLLALPTSSQIATAAAQAGSHQDAFVEKQRVSLRKIKAIKDQRRFNIEVRFYTPTPFQQFRMMFINNTEGLISFTALGKVGETGATMPQMVVNSKTTEVPNQSFYFPFKQQFERLWSESAPWDFISHV